MVHWHLHLVGGARLTRGSDAFTPERRSVAALAYLALEGATSRSRLAGLLWPDSPEATARNNLAQALRRLRARLGASLVVGDDPLELAPDVATDVAAYRDRRVDDPAEAPDGELLAGLDFDDLPEFDAWLQGARETFAALRARSLAALVERCESTGRFGAAADAAAALVALEPLAEANWRRLVRLRYLAGDRSAALDAYRRCRETLERELGVTPLPETVELARRIERGELPRPTGSSDEPSLPLEVLRPPRLIGRDEAWARMEEAWAHGRFIVLAGEAGVGKTRLALDFAASKGAHLLFEGRPGDRVVPFSTSVRSFRTLLAQGSGVDLPPWALRSLARVVPELAPPAPAPDGLPEIPLPEAVLRLMRTQLGVACLVYDDLQFADAASIDAGFYVISSSFPMGRPGGVPHWIACVRPDELSAHTREVLQQGVAAGHSAWIDLAPLGPGDTASLLASLELDALDALDDGATPRLAEALHRHTGGNALFLLETLRGLIETRSLTSAPPTRLPVPDRVDGIVRQRLARLSPTAQRIAQSAAVLQSDVDIDLVGRMLGVDPFDLVPAWEELERAQVFRGRRFSHDLIYEAALDGISPPVAALLHRRAADALAATGANPARVAKHCLAVGDAAEAGRLLRAVATLARAAGGVADAEALERRAAEMLDGVGGEEAAVAPLERDRRLARAVGKGAN